MKTNKYRNAIQVWVNISRKFGPTTGDSKTIIRNKFANFELDDVTINPK